MESAQKGSESQLQLHTASAFAREMEWNGKEGELEMDETRIAAPGLNKLTCSLKQMLA